MNSKVLHHRSPSRFSFFLFRFLINFPLDLKLVWYDCYGLEILFMELLIGGLNNVLLFILDITELAKLFIKKGLKRACDSVK